jgi:hypothetical protein
MPKTTDQQDSDRLVFLCLASLTVALFLLQVARLRGGAVLRTHRFGVAAHIVWTPPHWLRLTLIIFMLFFGMLSLWRLRAATKSAPGVGSWMRVGRWPIRWFFVGILVGAIVRFFLPNSNVRDFADGSAPIVAALLIAVLVSDSRKEHITQPRQIAVMYLLIGAVAAAIGTMDANGWIFGLFFELILGGIATSMWLVWDILPNTESGERV